MNLLIEYFTSTNTERYNEYNKCIKNNINSGLFDKIIVFLEGDTFPFDNSNVVKVIKCEKRPTYKDFFNYCNENLKDQVCIISNTDIYFDETITYINVDNLDKKFICLTRYDVLDDNNIVFFNKNNIGTLSQDTWVFKTPVNIDGGDYLMGKPGCDNKIALHAIESGYSVNNPSLLIKTYHLHNSAYRTYTRKDTVGGPYMGITPCMGVIQKSEYIKFG